MMNRRSLLTGSASLIALAASGASFAGSIFPDLEAIKWELMPGLWGTFTGTGIQADIEIRDGNLVVSAWAKGDRWQDDPNAMGFCITRESILDGEYKLRFGPQLNLLREIMDCQLFASSPCFLYR